MKKFFRRRIVYISIAIIIGIIAIISIRSGNSAPTWITDTVSQGSVRNIISVSGNVDAINTAELAFPTGGILESVNVKEGDIVTKGQTLATLSHHDLNADYQDAYASVLIAEANRDELINGKRSEERDVSKTTTDIAKEDLIRITNEQNNRVQNAYRTLLSTDLEVRPEDESASSVAPIISGSYTCTEGIYTIDLYRSGASSGYSYHLSGLESGTYTAYTESSSLLGTCGLSLQLISGETYGNSTWFIEIPNTESDSYVGNLNAFNLAITQRENAIREAEQKVTLAEQNNTLDTAAPRAEALSREEAQVLQSKARLAVVSSQIQDHVLVAPFSGTVTNIEPVVGESVGTAPVVTMIANDAFALTALIPEIDITRIRIGQKAEVVFDARDEETLPATLIFISPLAEEIDGVSYFEAKLVLDNTVDWLRSGLNADIDIIVDTRDNVSRIPRRFLKEENGSYTVLIPDGKNTKPVSVTVPFIGNDGYVEVAGLDTGVTIVAP